MFIVDLLSVDSTYLPSFDVRCLTSPSLWFPLFPLICHETPLSLHWSKVVGSFHLGMHTNLYGTFTTIH